MVVERKTLTGKLNDDAAYKVLPKEDYQNAENIQIYHGKNGGVAVAKNVPGTRVVTTALVDQTTYAVKGSITDNPNRRLFYFVESPSTGGTDEFILCYRLDTDDIVPVIKGTDIEDGLNFSGDQITGIALIKDVLYWCEGENNHPRKINVERGIASYDGSYTAPDGSTPTPYTLPLAEEDITLIKRPPQYPLQLLKVDSSESALVDDQDNNFIENESFQFSYRYRYLDGEVSVLGPWSQLMNYNGEDDEYDTIKVTIPEDEDVRKEVDVIEIVVRPYGTNNWRVIKTYRRDVDGTEMDAHSTTALSFYFFNDQLGVAIDEASAIKPFDNVPIYSYALSGGRDRLLLANNVEGYDPSTGLTLTASAFTQTEGAGLTVEYVLVYSYCTIGGDGELNEVILVEVSGSGDTNVDGYYLYSYDYFESDFTDGVLPTAIALTADDRIGAVADFTDNDLLELYSLCGGSYVQPPSYVDHTYSGTQPTVSGLSTPTSVGEGDRVFSVDSQYKLGIVQFDFAGRSNGVFTSADARVVTADRSYTQNVFNTAINWELTGTPEEWATHYAVVLTKNLSKSFFVWHYCSVVKYVSLDSDGNYFLSDTYSEQATMGLAWDTSRLIKPGLGYTYDSESDDVLKVYPNDDSDPVRYSVKGQFGKYVITDGEDIGDITAANIYENCLFEIYTPYKGAENKLFFEIGYVYPVTNAGLPGRSFSELTGSIMGDTYLRERTVDGTTFKVEAMSPNDEFWQEWNTDHGRSFVELLDSGQEHRITGISYSNTYVRGSKIRGLSSFDLLDQHTLGEEMGPIRKLQLSQKTQVDGTVLLAIGEEETASVYLGETQFLDNEAAQVVASSGNVIGTVNILRGSYGTVHPESVRENEGKVYFFDYNRGCVVRYAANGLYPVSDVGLKAFYARQSDQSLAADIFPGGIDEYTEEYLLRLPESEYDGTEYLGDMDVYIGGGVLSGGGGGISTLYEIEEGRPYRIDLTGLEVGKVVIFTVGGTTIFTLNTTEETYSHEFIAPASGNIGYSYTGIGRSNWELYGAEISCHQLWTGREKTIAFRDIDGAEGWSTTYSYFVEHFSRIGNKLISFVNGVLWVHDSTTTWNTFHGKQYPSVLSLVATDYPSSLKVAVSIGLESTCAPYRVHVRCENADNQVMSSYIGEASFRKREGLFYSGIRRDRLDPNGGGNADQNMFRGRKLRSQFPQFCIEYRKYDEPFQLQFVDIKYDGPPGHLTTNAQ